MLLRTFLEKSKAKVRISHKFAFRGNSHFAKIRISHKFAFCENSHFAKIRISHKFAFCENSHIAKIRISHKFAFPKNSHAKSRIRRQFRIMRIFRMRKFCSHFAKIMRIWNRLCDAMRMRNFAKFSHRMRILRNSHAKAHPCDSILPAIIKSCWK
jgi:hypothetical protein